jgi:hypothetical protein
MSGASPDMWLLALCHVCMIMNCMATESIGWKTPIQMLTGQVPDISPLQVQVQRTGFTRDSNQVSRANPRKRLLPGMAPNVGHAMTYKILTADTRSLCDPAYVLLRSKKQRTYVSITTREEFVSSGKKGELFQRLMLPTWTDLHHHAR